MIIHVSMSNFWNSPERDGRQEIDFPMEIASVPRVGDILRVTHGVGSDMSILEVKKVMFTADVTIDKVRKSPTVVVKVRPQDPGSEEDLFKWYAKSKEVTI